MRLALILHSLVSLLDRVCQHQNLIAGNCSRRFNVAGTTNSTLGMLTGVETAGLVLAVLPLIISALESYKKGLGPIKTFLRNWKIELATLIRCLKDQRYHFKINIHRFLKSAAPDEDAFKLSDDHSAALQDIGIQKQVQEYLTVQGSLEFFNQTMNDYEKSMRAIIANLGHIQRGAAVSAFVLTARYLYSRAIMKLTRVAQQELQ
jgi:hypothetical protein